MAQAAAEQEANIIYEPASPIEQKKYFEAEAAQEELVAVKKRAEEGSIFGRIGHAVNPGKLKDLEEAARTTLEDAVKAVEPKIMEPLTFNPLYLIRSLAHRQPTIHRRYVFAGFDVKEEPRSFGLGTRRVVRKGFKEIPPWEKIE